MKKSLLDFYLIIRPNEACVCVEYGALAVFLRAIFLAVLCCPSAVLAQLTVILTLVNLFVPVAASESCSMKKKKRFVWRTVDRCMSLTMCI